jgi:DNA-binding response OmpR family regulator
VRGGLDLAIIETPSAIWAEILRVLMRRPMANSNELADVIYTDARGGGPDNGAEVVRVTIYKHRRKLEAYGWRIASRRGNGGAYWLERL